MNHITCKVCHYTFGIWRVHCPACSTLSVKFAGRNWSTRKDGRISSQIDRARNAFDVEQVFERKIKTATVD